MFRTKRAAKVALIRAAVNSDVGRYVVGGQSLLEIALSHRYDYECSVLKGIAAIDYQHITNEGPIVTPENADPRLRLNETVAQMVCHNRHQCGIAYTDTDGNLAYNWNSCPAHKRFLERHSLLSTTRP